jgi:FAD/FMN-containing dehydrogenase
VDYRRCSDIDSLLAAIRETDERYQYSVAWVDCLSRGKALGRSVLMSGDHVPASDLPGRDPFHAPTKRKPNVPFNVPEFVLNSASIRLFNEVFYRFHPSVEGKIIGYDPYFYPLDAIHDWYRIYGKRGFAQYQATFPYEGAEGLVKLIEKFSRSSRASFLAVLKRMGPPSGGLLSHPIDGWTLTLDLPWRDGLLEFLQECDQLVLNHGGKLYMAKDVTTTPEVFAAMYPRLDEFRAIKARLDPDQRLSSRLARRVGIVENGART